MSGSPEDEAKARLEVAQLYEGMPGQAVKAARYYFAAAEIFRGAGLNTRAREIYQKVVQLEPTNTQAQALLQSLLQAGGQPAAAAPQAPQSSPGNGLGAPRTVSPPRPAGEPPQAGAPAVLPPRPTAPPASAAAAPPAAAPSAAPSGHVMVPTPWIGREPRYVAAARGQLTSPPDRKVLPYDPLPPVDPNKVAARAEARKQAQKELNRKSATRIESAFGNARSPFVAKAGATPEAAPAAAGRFGAAPAPEAKPAPAAPAAPKPPVQAPASRFGPPSGEMRGGNRDLAEAIRRKLQGS